MAQFEQMQETGSVSKEKPSTSGHIDDKKDQAEEVPGYNQSAMFFPCAKLFKQNKGTQKGLRRPICHSKGN